MMHLMGLSKLAFIFAVFALLACDHLKTTGHREGLRKLGSTRILAGLEGAGIGTMDTVEAPGRASTDDGGGGVWARLGGIKWVYVNGGVFKMGSDNG